jgi:L-ascorbate metabolism protein UlaG (beta-lactamase superfamily)
MRATIEFRWLGVAGIELRANGQTLLIDPFLTRFPLWRMWFGCVHSDRERIAKEIPRCDFVLATHAHWDHLMDVPEVVHNTNAMALGSSHTCRLLAASGVETAQIQEIGAGDKLTLGEFQVEVLPAKHMTILGLPMLSGPLPTRLQPPLRAGDYRMDRCFSFLIYVAGQRLLDWCSVHPEPAVPAEVLFARPYQTHPFFEALLRDVQPRLVIPTHWDDFFRPLSKPVRPMFKPPRWSWPPLQRVNLARFKQMVEQIAPKTQVLIPERFQIYDLHWLTNHQFTV